MVHRLHVTSGDNFKKQNRFKVKCRSKGWGVAQVVEGLHSTHEALGSNSGTVGRKEKKKNKRKQYILSFKTICIFLYSLSQPRNCNCKINL
jgi:hypothetical protein